MAGLRWMAVTLAVFLSTGNSLAVGQNQLLTIVQQVRRKYTNPNDDQSKLPMFSLAVSIPKSGESYDVGAVPDNGEDVKNAMLKCEVFTGTKVVGATLLSDVFNRCKDGRVQRQDVLAQCPPGVVTWLDVEEKCKDKVGNIDDHAEYRTLQALSAIQNNNNFKDLMLFYVYAAPCDQKCTSEKSDWSILNTIQQITKWGNYAVVFKKLFIPKVGEKPTKPVREQSLRNLASSGKIGLQNIFRCDNIEGQMQCLSCSTDGLVTHYCVSDKKPKQKGGEEDEDGWIAARGKKG
ncbi:uncharacterized protein LOC130166633 [Seriola aureovittata]|uniref:uncharacterized protein LOC130166633 n=1 Tax=Seriola aureovittata TaxID=2871759 RepID=UPI0024BE685C|nr:uncharacterized protein LOC130166633 [Seriola aureovittata]